MENLHVAERDLFALFSIAVLHGEGDEIGTDELLLALVRLGVRQDLLDAAGLTRTVAAAVYQGRHASWASDDRGPVTVLIADGGEPADVTAAAADVLRDAHGPDDVLRALLDDPDSRAAEMLATCAVPVPALRDSLRDGSPLQIDDPVPAELHRIRDTLIGRTRYPRYPFWRNPLLALVAPARTNLAPVPQAWLPLETRQQATERGRRDPGTDDALLALTAMHEVVAHYPHLYDTTAGLYDGTALLAEAGITHAVLRHVADTTELGTDPTPLNKLPSRHPDDPATGWRDTSYLLRRLLAEPGNRAHRLLTNAGFDHVRVR